MKKKIFIIQLQKKKLSKFDKINDKESEWWILKQREDAIVVVVVA